MNNISQIDWGNDLKTLSLILENCYSGKVIWQRMFRNFDLLSWSRNCRELVIFPALLFNKMLVKEKINKHIFSEYILMGASILKNKPG